ncbi:MAG: adenylosuccinate synthase [Ignavibacteria bacterium 13_1_40CM_2_61_4]|nr:MAG: adenylosuccinate synthase [Ignavibacteria bacterium 13_1_40CM_2_61_4]
MPVQVIVGAQWGDEGKGKIVDHLSAKIDIVARYQGGANAGHTVVIGEQEVVLHLIPSGIFHPHVTCVIGNGVVIDPIALMSEIEQLRKLNVDMAGRLLISHNAHLIMPYHKLLDSIREQTSEPIGTTGRGIGPAYIDKFMRVGIRIVDLLNRDVFVSKLRRNIDEKNQILKKIYGKTELDVDRIVCEYEEFDKKIDPFVTDTVVYLNGALGGKKRILAEGAQGALLDIDHGTYPFVTSSSPTSGGACTGLGIPPTSITGVLGVVKAYSTRVGNGPFPTELGEEAAGQLRNIGGEYGSTTGRPRRCGWFDAVSVRHSVAVNGIGEIAVTKLDVLDSFDQIRVCTAYRLGEKTMKHFPTDASTLESVEPHYETFDGWKISVAGARRYTDLPANARRYVEALGEITGTRVGVISVGARRDQTIVRGE